jgi:selenocysteine-specific elongation factor
VPGHERFIKNMLAGVGGIDIALLVVAADEGVMPQTREHLAILDLLGIDSGVVAITKRDLVDDDWLDLIRAEVEDTLSSTTMARAPLLAVSSTTGEGLDELRGEIDRQLAHERHRRQTGWPRLPVDRIFTMSGFGTVVTGTLIDGELHVGQEVEILPPGRRARIRGLQSHQKRIDVALAGTRVAINLSGVATDEIERGEVITTPGWLKPARVLDVRLRVVDDAPKPLAHNAQVTFHTGAAEALGKVALLDHQELRPGETGWAQVRLDGPVAAVKGDLFVVRYPSPSLTIGGGTIVDERPKRHRRFQERVLGQLAVLERGTPEEVLVQTLQTREPADLGDLAKRAAQTVAEALALVQPMVRDGQILALGAADGPLTSTTLLVSLQGWERIVSQVGTNLESYHREHPLRRGMPREELRKRLGQDARVFTQVERALLERELIAQEGPLARLPEHRVVLSADEQAKSAALIGALTATGIAPPSRGELQAKHGLSDELVLALLDRGDVVEVSPDLIYARETYEQLVDDVKRLIQQNGPVSVGSVRDTFNTSRKYALAILEHLDERKITRRIGDERVLA